jgi:hypothetical protein
MDYPIIKIQLKCNLKLVISIIEIFNNQVSTSITIITIQRYNNQETQGKQLLKVVPLIFEAA